MKKVILYGIAFVLLVASTWGYTVFVKRFQVESELTETLMPKRLLQAGEIIEESMIKKVEIKVDAHRRDAIKNKKDLVGMTVLVPIGQTEEFVPWKLSNINRVPLENERYYAFPTNSLTNVSNMVRKGDRVDVWVEFPEPVIGKLNGEMFNFSAIKIIENLYVSHVRTVEGIEITDGSGDSIEMFSGDREQFVKSRNVSSGMVDQNTYIMSEEIYDAYVMGGLLGSIKLSLPNLTSYPNESAAAITDVFSQYKSTGVLNPGFDGSSFEINGVDEANVQGQEKKAESDM